MKRLVTLDEKEIGFIVGALEHNAGDSALIKKLSNAGKTIKRASAKSKGFNLQKRVCEDIAAACGVGYSQSDDNCLIHSRERGQRGSDIVLRGEIAARFPYSIECKSTEATNIVSFINQAKWNTAPQKQWLVVYKGKALHKPVAIMDWENFLKSYIGEGKR
jgi:hypothetical protein